MSNVITLIKTSDHHESDGKKIVKALVPYEAKFIDLIYDPVERHVYAAVQVPDEPSGEQEFLYFLGIREGQKSIMLGQQNRGAFIKSFKPTEASAVWFLFHWHTNEWKPGELD